MAQAEPDRKHTCAITQAVQPGYSEALEQILDLEKYCHAGHTRARNDPPAVGRDSSRFFYAKQCRDGLIARYREQLGIERISKRIQFLRDQLSEPQPDAGITIDSIGDDLIIDLCNERIEQRTEAARTSSIVAQQWLLLKKRRDMLQELYRLNMQHINKENQGIESHAEY